MKKNQFVKFSLTVVCAAVLAACSSGGGSNNNAAAEAAAAEAAAKAAAEKAAAEKAAAEKAAAEAAAKAEAELQNKLATTGDEGAKSVKKTLSNLVTNHVVEAANSRSSSSITGMTVALYPTLDTIVVATPVDSNGNAVQNAAQVYLEDFDFRGNDRAAAPNAGRYVLNHIHNINAAETDPTLSDNVIGNTAGVGAARTGTINPYTKTELMGNESGTAFVYENGRLNYTKKVEGPDVLDARVARTEFLANGTADVEGRLDNSVAEVYGYRTFVAGDSVTGTNAGVVARTVGEAQAEQYQHSNAPFQASGVITAATAQDSGTKKVGGADADYTAAGMLNYVQYGRVTSKLDQVELDNLRQGKNIVTLGTKIGSFGGYGDEGTEDHYFYRGVVSTPYAADLKATLGQAYGHKETVIDANGNKTETVTPAGVLDYRGHAVTYNLDRNLNLGDKVPNAIGYTQQLVSGTHVNANIDLSSGAVTGRLYNVWQYDNGQASNTITDNLANFAGTLANNGSIVGTANKLASSGAVDTAGTLVASLFGPNGEELGGTIKSSDTYNSWGASFGASVQNAATGSTINNAGGKTPAIGESTDQGNVNNPNIAP